MPNPFASITGTITTGIIAALASAVAIQTVRIEGLWFIHGYKQDLRACETTVANMEAASALALERQIASTKAIEARYRAEAEKTDAMHLGLLRERRKRRR